jgi:hypothetical protein
MMTLGRLLYIGSMEQAVMGLNFGTLAVGSNPHLITSVVRLKLLLINKKFEQFSSLAPFRTFVDGTSKIFAEFSSVIIAQIFSISKFSRFRIIPINALESAEGKLLWRLNLEVRSFDAGITLIRPLGKRYNINKAK